jgi:DNA-binding transcriptional LysR family regulator
MGVVGVELRQLRYFVTLAEELHFGRAAARGHIVQSALSQQLQRLERELGTPLLERTTHHVRMTPAGSAFLPEARQILAHLDRAVAVAQHAARSAPTLRMGMVDASYDSLPAIVRRVQARFPDLEIHQVRSADSTVILHHDAASLSGTASRPSRPPRACECTAEAGATGRRTEQVTLSEGFS